MAGRQRTRTHARESLRALAALHGVAASYHTAADKPVTVPDDTLRAILASLDVDASSDAATEDALAAAREAQAGRLAERTIVLRGRRRRFAVRARGPVEVELATERGERLAFGFGGRSSSGGRRLTLPADIPVGYHRYTVRADGREQSGLLVRAPERCPPFPGGHVWGWMAQVYSLRSRGSWGIGDLADLAMLARRSAEDFGADFVLSSPLGVASPSTPQHPSPYSPSSRRYQNPIYLRPEHVAEFDALAGEDATAAAACADEARALNAAPLIERDAAMRLKMRAFEALFRAPRSRPRERALTAFREREGGALREFATFCALAERHGVPYQSWPAALRHPSSAGVAAAQRELAERIEFHSWLQWLCDEEMDATQAAARERMAIGVIHDLPVGVDRGGADAWAQQDGVAQGISVGAPPDLFSPGGQDWGLPPWRPDRLEAARFRPLRDLVRALLRHAAGIRIDHALGLFRLYWIPDGLPRSAGTYVAYPAEAMLACLAIEAARAGAGVIAEDLGTVGANVRARLDAWGVYGSAVLLFEREEGGQAFLPAERYRRRAFASITTHDLPTAAAFWTGAAIGERERLGLLDARALKAERSGQRRARAQFEATLRERGPLASDATLGEQLAAMHEFIGSARSALVGVGLTDALGDERQPNMPGTVEEYPNWRLPLTTREGEPLPLEEALADPRLIANAQAVRRGRRSAARRKARRG